MDNTSIYDIKELRQEIILSDLCEVIKAMDEKGYNATNQIVGYILNNDPSYITSYKNSRKKICKYNRGELLMVILNGYLER